MIFGRHTLIELHGCDAAALGDQASLRTLMLTAIKEAGGTYVTDVFHHFSPQGVSGVVVIAESHATIHTWPEHGYAAVDVFTCGGSFIHHIFSDIMRDGLKAARIEAKTIERGRLPFRGEPVAQMEDVSS
jgi:S-adenosylmethionine decarboxylase proenzyme